MLCWINRSTAVRLRDLALPLYSPLARLHLKYCCPVLGSLVQEGCGYSGCKPIKGQWRWMGAGAHNLGGEAERVGLVQIRGCGEWRP